MGKGELSAEHVAQLFFDSVVRVFGLPDEVLHDRDPRFTADFWRLLWDSLGSRRLSFQKVVSEGCFRRLSFPGVKKAVFSSAYHPQTDGKIEHAHHTIE